MSWFERQAAERGGEAFTREQGRYIRAAGVDRALEALAGPFGVRRFLVHFARQGVRVRIRSLEAVPLRWGGGPPPADPDGRRLAALEQSLGRLHANMGVGPRWDRGAIGYVRDAHGQSTLFPLFDDDADAVELSLLPAPPEPGHPLEEPAYRAVLERWESDLQRVHARTAMLPGDWEEWRLEDERLTLEYPGESRRFRCQVLGTFEPAHGRFTWQAGDWLFTEPAAFATKRFTADWDAAMELGLLACARLGADWLFVGAYGDQGEVLLAAARG